MENELKLKEIVKEKYGKLAFREDDSCGDSGCCCTSTNNIMSENYHNLSGYNPEADLGLGCGLPTKFAKIKKGDTVIDLGSGAGNDCFIARAEAGENGKIIGIDFTPEMIEKARNNVKKRGYINVEFIQGDIENIPVSSNLADVIVSNCVLNLVPNKKAVFNEMYRVLKPNGHFSISDIVLMGDLPEKIKSAVEMYSGCVSGAIKKDIYLQYIEEAGFKNITLQKEKSIVIPDEELKDYLTEEEIILYKKDTNIIKSITVYAEK
ncbi:MAG: arsenite methyltransferase [Spirochaetales bacterium]|jgi:ubiquinone/menaquinone biosynthesis C-methylase UbiE|nr:arsenite methyltransferase [Spirochaetales bacterium]